VKGILQTAVGVLLAMVIFAAGVAAYGRHTRMQMLKQAKREAQAQQAAQALQAERERVEFCRKWIGLPAVTIHQRCSAGHDAPSMKRCIAEAEACQAQPGENHLTPTRVAPHRFSEHLAASHHPSFAPARSLPRPNPSDEELFSRIRGLSC